MCSLEQARDSLLNVMGASPRSNKYPAHIDAGSDGNFGGAGNVTREARAYWRVR